MSKKQETGQINLVIIHKIGCTKGVKISGIAALLNISSLLNLEVHGYCYFVKKKKQTKNYECTAKIKQSNNTVLFTSLVHHTKTVETENAIFYPFTPEFLNWTIPSMKLIVSIISMRDAA